MRIKKRDSQKNDCHVFTLLQAFKILEEHLFHFLFVPIDHNSAVDVKGGGNELAIGPLAHLFGRVHVASHVYLDVLNTVMRQPGARFSAIGTPPVAIHRDVGLFGYLLLFLLLDRCQFYLRLDAINFSEKDLIAGLIINIVNVDVLNDALFVDDEDRPLGVSLRAKHAVQLSHLAVGPEIAHQRVRNPAEAIGPRL